MAMRMSSAAAIPLITASAQECLDALGVLWNEVGLGVEERDEACHAVIGDVRRVLEARVVEMKETRAQMSLQIRVGRVKLHGIQRQLSDCAAHHESWKDEEVSPNTPLSEQLAALKEALAAAEEDKAGRLADMTECAEELRCLLDELDEDIGRERATELLYFDEDSENLSAMRVEALETEMERCRDLRSERREAIEGLCSEIGEVCDLLGVSKGSYTEARSLSPTEGTMAKLRARIEELQLDLVTSQERRAAVLADIAALHEKLEKPKEDMERLVEAHPSLHAADMAQLDREVGRLRAELLDRLPELIASERECIADMCKSLLVEDGDLQTEGDASEACLEQLVEEKERLRALLELSAPLLKGVERREAILKEKVIMKDATSAADPSRLLDRGSSSFRLRQEEERRRNMVEKELPRLSEKLKRQIGEWEEANDQPFLVRGKRYIVTIEEEERRDAEAKEEERARRDREKEEERQRKAARRNTPQSPVPSSMRQGRVGESPARRPVSAHKREAGRFQTVPQRSPATRTPVRSSRAPGSTIKDSSKAMAGAGDGGKENSNTPGATLAAAAPQPQHEADAAAAQRTALAPSPSPKNNMIVPSLKKACEKAGPCDVVAEQKVLHAAADAEVDGNDASVRGSSTSSSNDDANNANADGEEEARLLFSPRSEDQGGAHGLPIAETTPLEHHRSPVVPSSPAAWIASPAAPSSGLRGMLLSPAPSCFPRVLEEGEEEEETLAGGGLAEEESTPTRTPAGAGSDSLAMGDWDYLADNYFTDEERIEIGRELARELRERGDEIATLQKGTKQVKFKKGELLGAGSFGQVFLGLNEDTGELMAVKEVDCSRAGEGAIADLEAEITVLQQLRHPNIVAYFGVHRDQNISVLVEYCAGGSIASVISKFGALSESVVRSYTRQILAGLDYLHAHCIVHRDVKCANCLLDADGNVKVADFGASRRMSSVAEAAAMSMKGTPSFMAPEVITQTNVGRQADIWAAGCCVVEMATGTAPFANQFSNIAALLWHVVKQNTLPDLPDTLSADCKDFCVMCFKREPKDRPSARRLHRHPFVAMWNDIHASRHRGGGGGGQQGTPVRVKDNGPLSVANKRISALF